MGLSVAVGTGVKVGYGVYVGSGVEVGSSVSVPQATVIVRAMMNRLTAARANSVDKVEPPASVRGYRRAC